MKRRVRKTKETLARRYDMTLFDSNSFAWGREECKQGERFKRCVHSGGSQILQVNVNKMQIRKRKYQVMGSDPVQILTKKRILV